MVKDDGGSAFPNFIDRGEWNEARSMYVPEKLAVGGMSLRQWYAGLAMQGLCANPNTASPMDDPEQHWIRKKSHEMADAMLAYERSEEKELKK